MTWKPIDSVPFRPGLLVKVIQNGEVNLFRTISTSRGRAIVTSMETPSYPFLRAGYMDSWTWARSAWGSRLVTDVLVAMPLCPKEVL